MRLRYFLRLTVAKAYGAKAVHEETFRVYTTTPVDESESNNAIKMEVGIEDCLHIEFEYNKSRYHLREVVLGKIFFLLVRIRIKHMELAIIKRESSGVGANAYTESDTVAKCHARLAPRSSLLLLRPPSSLLECPTGVWRPVAGMRSWTARLCAARRSRSASFSPASTS